MTSTPTRPTAPEPSSSPTPPTVTADGHGDVETDVVIVGYGPSGVAAANALGAAGLRAVAIERDRDIYPRARAVTVNDWTMRLFQSVGLDEQLLADMDVNDTLRWVTYAGKEVMRSKIPPSSLGHAGSHMIYQPAMEATLRAGVQRYAEHVHVRFGEEFAGITQDSSGVVVTSRDVTTGANSTIRGRYALACDGGGSQVRAALDVPLIGSTLPTQWVVIDARIKRWWPEQHVLTFWADADRPVVDIPLALGNHRWEFPLRAEESTDDFATHEQLWPLLESMGRTRDEVEIHQHAFYRHHLRHAERWRVGRTFLLGDAAHMMPPWAGQGMQSGIRDAFNLAWKLREVLTGRLPDTVLDTYQPERAPNVALATAISERLGRIITQRMTRQEKAQAGVGMVLGKLHLPLPPSPLAASPTLTAGWLHGTAGTGGVGEMVPQPLVASASGHRARLDDVLGSSFVLLGNGVDPSTLLTSAQRSGWDALGARYLAVRPATSSARADSDVMDIDGSLTSWMRSRKVRAVAVRPDRFVAASDVAGLDVPHPGSLSSDASSSRGEPMTHTTASPTAGAHR